jgi:ABC-type multidrug transport system fused ATPase/permease subunit
MAQMAALNVLAAIAIFVELQLLRALTVALSRGPSPATCSLGDWIGSGFSLAPEPCGAQLPLFLLVTYGLSIAVQSCVDVASFAVSSRLTQQARHDVERELLRNLLRQDDAFYVRRSPSEIISRLGGDLHRVGGRRQIVTQAIATGLSVIAIAWVLAIQSWLAAAIGLAISLLGVLAMQPTVRRLRALDREAIASDEKVKAAFEDTLQGVAEIQVSGLLGRVLDSFGMRQRARDAVALQNADLTNRNTVLQRLTFNAGFIAVLVLFVFTSLFHDSGAAGGVGEGAATAGLIVVLIATLPQLYFKFGELAQLLTQFQIADVSSSRLRQYEAPPPRPPRPTAADGAIVLRNVRYRFSGSQAVRGGPSGITCTIPPRGLIGIVGPAGAGKSTLVRLILGREQPLDGSIAEPASGGGSAFVYLPQRPVLFDARLRDNLFLSSERADAGALALVGERLGPLGLLDLVRQKGLDASPGAAADGGANLAAVRDGFQRAAAAALGTELRPLGPGHSTPRQMTIESQLGCAVDQAVLAERLTSPVGRAPVRALAALPYGRAMVPLAAALIRQTAPLLAQAGTPDDYNRIAVAKLDPRIWQLRSAALEAVMGSPDGPPSNAPQPLLVAVALSARLEELDNATLPAPDTEARRHLDTLVGGITRPLQADRLNPLLTWRENLLFAVPDPANTQRLAQLDRVLLDHLATAPLDGAVVEAGLDYPVGRQGGRLSGGQQQLVALGRALLNPAPFLVLDEPSSAFHPRLRLDLIGVLQAEARSRSVIAVTHDMDLARGCERLLFVQDGALAGDGSWADLAAGNAAFRTWIASSGEAA